MLSEKIIALLICNYLISIGNGSEGSYDDTELRNLINGLEINKSDKSAVYTKAETEDLIVSKIAEIVADAPEDFNTLKEMSDWIANHETSAASMNSAIQTNASNISSLQADKVDKETGKSLVSDSEISRLATVSNYDDTAVKSDIADIQSVIPAAASPSNQLADKAYVAAAASGSPYVYMTQAEYESLTEYEPDRLYWVTYPLSKCHLIWCNGECVDGIGAENLAGYELTYNDGSYKSYTKCNYKYLAIAYNPIGVSSQSTYPNLIKLDVAKGVTSIGHYAFYGCSGLTNVSIPDGVTSIGAGAFCQCQALTDISIPAGVTEIKGDTFVSCRALTFVSIPNTVTTIAVKKVGISLAAFANCTQNNLTITINKPSGSISGSPWGATNATIIWAG